jgi:hypothetical protein
MTGRNVSPFTAGFLSGFPAITAGSSIQDNKTSDLIPTGIAGSITYLYRRMNKYNNWNKHVLTRVPAW